MAKIIKNKSITTKTYAGYDLAQNETHTILVTELQAFQKSEELIADILSGASSIYSDIDPNEIIGADGVTYLLGTGVMPEIDTAGHVVVRAMNQKTQDKTMSKATHDFCNKQTWYSRSLRVVGETPTLISGNDYQLANTFVIDTVNGLINRQDLYQSTYKEIVYIDGVAQTGGYTVDYRLGKITLDSPLVGVLTVDYSYATNSEWSVTVDPGNILVIEHSEVQFTEDVSITSPLRFEVWITHPLYGRIIGEQIQYNSIRDIINESNLGFHVPPMPDIGKSLIIFPFNYVGEKQLDGNLQAELIVKSADDSELIGTYGTATFYLIERTEA